MNRYRNVNIHYSIIVLIDTWWNVNTFEFLAFTSCICVLIDTWWNVNRARSSSDLALFSVLIDTWWNVNVYTYLAEYPEVKSFNRYMVECEYEISL